MGPGVASLQFNLWRTLARPALVGFGWVHYMLEYGFPVIVYFRLYIYLYLFTHKNDFYMLYISIVLDYILLSLLSHKLETIFPLGLHGGASLNLTT